MSAVPATIPFLPPLAISLVLSVSSSLLCTANQPKTSPIASLSAPYVNRGARRRRGAVAWLWGVGGTPTNRFSNPGVVWAGRKGIHGAVAPSGVRIGGRASPIWSAPRSIREGEGGKGCYFLAIAVCATRLGVRPSAGRSDGSAPLSPPILN